MIEDMEATKQNCFVQIRDKRKWEQTVDFLHEIGVKNRYGKDGYHFIGDDTDVLFVEGDEWIDTYIDTAAIAEAKQNKNVIDCGKNILLFLAIVRMRLYSDEKQYFVSTVDQQWVNQGKFMPKGSIIFNCSGKMEDENTRRATVEEIVEFFKKFPNGMPRLTKVSDEERERMRINSYDPLL